jgi:beta-glucosidase
MGVEDKDFDRIKARFDFIGINHYNRMIVSTATPGMPGSIPGQPRGGEEGPKTDFGWEIWPRGFHDIVMWAWKEYALPIEITENGCAYGDGPDAVGRVKDARRVDFYRQYLTELARAIQEGADVRGYHAWTLLDNFEWAEGFGQRFGLVHVDFKSLKRTIKDSGHWYARVAAANALRPASDAIDPFAT